MSDERRFSEDQVKAIMGRAIELDQKPQETPEDGMRLTELEEMAAEIGVPAEHVHAAIVEFESGEPSSVPVKAFGEAVVERTTRVVQAVLSEEELNTLAASLPSLVEANGQVSVFGRTLSFTTSELEAMRTGSRVRIAIHAGTERTHIALTEDLRNVAGGVFGGIVGGLGIGAGFGVGFGVGLGLLSAPLFAAIFPLASLGLAFVGARSLYRSIVRARRHRAAREVDHIARAILASEDTSAT